MAAMMVDAYPLNAAAPKFARRSALVSKSPCEPAAIMWYEPVPRVGRAWVYWSTPFT